jgi:GSH-dependent disulfide-bond oxidoreductase
MRRLSPAGLAKFSGDWDLRWLRIFRGGPKERLHPGSREMLMARTAEKQKKRRRKVRSAPKSVKTAPPAGSRKPIDLYYWPTPNGWKITVMLEECALPYTMIPVDISKGDQFKPHFLAISPNNRMPAIVDYDGLNGKPISIFESGAILQYLGRKIGKFYPQDERGRVEVDQWLFWQMANLGPKAGEANHFRNYAPEHLPYAIKRFSNEMNRIYGVMNRRLEDREFLAGKYSIADIACIGWASRAERHGHDLSAFANVRRWLETVLARPAVKRGLSVKVEAAFHVDLKDPKIRAVLFNQRAR